MSFFSATGTFAKSTGGAPVSQDINTTDTATSTAFVPKVLILFATGYATVEDNMTAEMSFAKGFSDGTNGWSVVVSSDDNVSTTICKRYHAAKALTIINNAGTVLAVCDATFSANKFTVNWTTNNAVGLKIHYIALGGTDITNVKVGSYTADTTAAPNNQAVTGLGFQPTFLYELSMVNPTAPPNVANHTQSAWAFFNASTGAGGWTFAQHNVAPTPGSNDSAIRINNFQAVITKATVVTYQGSHTLSSFDSDGFTVAWSVTPGTAFYIGYLAMAGNFQSYTPNGSVFSVTGTGDTSFTGFGFKPSAVLQITNNGDALDIADFGFGASSGGNANASNFAETWPSSIQRAYEGSSATYFGILGTLAAPPVLQAAIKLKTFDNDGITITADTLTATTGFAIIAFGAALVPSRFKVVQVKQAVNRAGSY